MILIESGGLLGSEGTPGPSRIRLFWEEFNTQTGRGRRDNPTETTVGCVVDYSSGKDV